MQSSVYKDRQFENDALLQDILVEWRFVFKAHLDWTPPLVDSPSEYCHKVELCVYEMTKQEAQLSLTNCATRSSQ